MKINYYEAFDLIAEEAVDLLAEHQSDDSFLDKFSVEDTLSAVQGNMTQKKVVKKRMPMKIRFLIAAVMVLMVAAISFADRDGGAQLITDENRHLVGKETIVDSEDVLIIDKDGNIVNGELPTDRTEDVWKTSSVIKRVKDANSPSSITEITVEKKEDIFVTPEIITWNGDLVIMMKEDGEGWYLEAGQSLIYDVELYPSEINDGNGQVVAFYQICDGVFYGKVMIQEYRMKNITR